MGSGNTKQIHETDESFRRMTVDFITQHFFPDAPILIKHGLTPLQPQLITIDPATMKHLPLQHHKEMENKVYYPTFVSVSLDGTAEIVFEGTGVHHMLTYMEISSSIEKAASAYSHIQPPEAPYLLIASQTSLMIGWTLPEPPGIVRKVELQYRCHEDNSKPHEWRNLTERKFGYDEFSSHNVCNLLPGMELSFRVLYYCIYGASEFSDASEVMRTLPAPPPTPEGLKCIYSLHNCALICWDKVKTDNGSPITCYSLRGRSTGGDFTTLYSGLSIDFLVMYLFPDFAYTFEVCAVNAVGESAYSDRLSIITPKFRRRGEGDSLSRTIADLSLTRRDVWLECFDQTSRREFYFNRISGSRQIEVPHAILAPVSTTEEEEKEKKEKIAFREKRFRLLSMLRRSNEDSFHDSRKAHLICASRSHILYDGFQIIHSLPLDAMKKRFKIHFDNEIGIDSGGLSKEFYMLLSRNAALYAASSARKLIKFDSRHGIYFSVEYLPIAALDIEGINVDQINPSDVQLLAAFDFVEYAYFLGRLVGKAIYDEQLIYFCLSSALAKAVLDIDASIEDLKLIDSSLLNSLQWMLDNDITDVIDETFSVFDESSSSQVQLCEGGKDKAVTESNKHEYVRLRIAWNVRYCVHRNVDLFLKGLWSIVPLEYLHLTGITHDELNALVLGQAQIDIDQIRAFCIYQGTDSFDDQHITIVYFWGILRIMSDPQKELLLQFVTGSNRIPLDGFHPPFLITQGVDMEVDSLPKAHTCFNQIVLPEYSTLETFRERLIFAIENCQVFELA